NVDVLRSAEAPLPETNYAGRNRSRYMNPEFDGLIERYLATVAVPDRMEILGQIVHHVSDQLNAMGLFYDLKSFLISNRIRNVNAARATWNVNEWDVSV